MSESQADVLTAEEQYTLLSLKVHSDALSRDASMLIDRLVALLQARTPCACCDAPATHKGRDGYMRCEEHRLEPTPSSAEVEAIERPVTLNDSGITLEAWRASGDKKTWSVRLAAALQREMRALAVAERERDEARRERDMWKADALAARYEAVLEGGK